MGEISDTIMNGDMCQECGVWMLDPPGNGYPRTCEFCLSQHKPKPKKRPKPQQPKDRPAPGGEAAK